MKYFGPCFECGMNVLVIDFAYFHLAGTLEIFHLIRFSPSGDLEMRSGLESANW